MECLRPERPGFQWMSRSGRQRQEWEESMEQIYDLVILGSGPAGLGASIYAQRAELKTLVIEKEMVSGGQVLTLRGR